MQIYKQFLQKNKFYDTFFVGALIFPKMTESTKIYFKCEK